MGKAIARQWCDRRARDPLTGSLARYEDVFVEQEPVDVTTTRTTPTVPLMAIPSSTLVRVNGGVLRNSLSWWSACGGTPNRWLSVPRPVGPSSMPRRFRSPGEGDLPPPRAQENMRGKARPLSRASAEMGRSTDADGERERARASPKDSLHRRLDKRCFIDGVRSRLDRHVDGALNGRRWLALPNSALATTEGHPSPARRRLLRLLGPNPGSQDDPASTGPASAPISRAG